MSGLLNIKLLLKLSILATFVTCLWFISSKGTSRIKLQESAQFQKQIPVTMYQLPADKGIIPVELQCEDAELSAPNALEKLSCIVKNNTEKYISAGVLHISLTLEREGKTISVSNYDTMDTFLHPDFRVEHPDNLIAPGGSYRLDDLPSSFDDRTVIKVISVRVDYLEFTDNFTLGPNQGGARIIADTRTGAAKFKKWLAQKYSQNQGAIEKITPLLDKNQPLPEELELANSNQQQGASLYRNFARRIYENKGSAGLIKHLKQ